MATVGGIGLLADALRAALARLPPRRASSTTHLAEWTATVDDDRGAREAGAAPAGRARGQRRRTGVDAGAAVREAHLCRTERARLGSTVIATSIWCGVGLSCALARRRRVVCERARMTVDLIRSSRVHRARARRVLAPKARRGRPCWCRSCRRRSVHLLIRAARRRCRTTGAGRVPGRHARRAPRRDRAGDGAPRSPRGDRAPARGLCAWSGRSTTSRHDLAVRHHAVSAWCPIRTRGLLPREVDHIFTVPLTDLMAPTPNARDLGFWAVPSRRPFPVAGQVIWGATIGSPNLLDLMRRSFLDACAVLLLLIVVGLLVTIAEPLGPALGAIPPVTWVGPHGRSRVARERLRDRPATLDVRVLPQMPSRWWSRMRSTRALVSAAASTSRGDPCSDAVKGTHSEGPATPRSGRRTTPVPHDPAPGRSYRRRSRSTSRATSSTLQAARGTARRQRCV